MTPLGLKKFITHQHQARFYEDPAIGNKICVRTELQTYYSKVWLVHYLV
jgi:hypothetical protein